MRVAIDISSDSNSLEQGSFEYPLNTQHRSDPFSVLPFVCLQLIESLPLVDAFAGPGYHGEIRRICFGSPVYDVSLATYHG